MQEDGLRARVRKRYRCTTMSDHDQPIAPNLLDRRFEAELPNRRWVGDVTEILTGQGKLYLAVILDLFSRMVVGWALSAANDRHLALRALEHALRRRCPEAGLLHHTDQGSPYASEDYQRVLAAHGITCSMSRRGNAHDNAAMESWFSTMTFELGDRFETHPSARQSCSTTSRCSTTRAQALDVGVLEPSSVRESSTDGAGSSVINLSTESGQAQSFRRTAPRTLAQPIPVEPASLHDREQRLLRRLQHADVLQRIAVEHEQVGKGVRPQAPEPPFPAQHPRPHRRR